jgi:hypothetical protein
MGRGLMRALRDATCGKLPGFWPGAHPLDGLGDGLAALGGVRLTMLTVPMFLLGIDELCGFWIAPASFWSGHEGQVGCYERTAQRTRRRRISLRHFRRRV